MTDALVYHPPSRSGGSTMVFNTEAAAVVARKAEDVLKFAPAVNRERAMDLTLEWVRHMRIF